VYSLTTQPAVFNAQTPRNPVSGTFSWKTDCEHLNKNDYPVLFKAEDNFESPSLVDIKTVFIKVLAPAPQNLTLASLSADSVVLNWDSPYACGNNSKFLQFSVWRKIGCGNPVDSCNTDLASQGYILLGYTSNYTYTDRSVAIGNEYSYKVRAEFATLSATNVQINPFSSLPSEEICAKPPMDIPMLYNVDVRTTDASGGEIYVEWSRPNPDELDTIVNHGLYTFTLYRAESNSNNYTPVVTKTFPVYSAINDTSFLDTNLNTENIAYQYKVEFITNTSDTLGSSSAATSVFLSAAPSHQSVNLSWEMNTPWEDKSFIVYRQNPGSSVFDSIATTTTPNFTDTGLINDSTYCYKIEAIGAYSITGLKTPLINYSQEICATPVDTLPPCAPALVLNNFCLDNHLSDEDFVNYLIWNFDNECDTSTIVNTYLYYKNSSSANYILLDSIAKGSFPLAYSHNLNAEQTLAGCYYLETLGKNGKKTRSNTVCSDDCPLYQLPNAITPNGDGQNDVFTPIKPYRGVEKIDLKIYNRWGNQVFETENPAINWNGTDFKNGKALPTAVYYYVCFIYYKTANGINKIKEPLSGYIHIF
jgi:gliding motility-associated-like protein